MKFSGLCAVALASVVVSTPDTRAAVVVEFDGTNGTMATGGVNWGTSAHSTIATTDNPNDSVRSTLPYGTTLLETGVGNYLGPTVVGGAYENAVYPTSTSLSSADFQSSWGQLFHGSTDLIRIRRNGPSGSLANSVTRAAYTIVTSSPGPFKFDGDSVLNLTGGIGTHTDTNEEGRWLVVSGSTLYVSETAIDLQSGSSNTYALDNPDEINWAAWTPGGDLSLGSLTFDTTGTSLTDIVRAGFYFDKTGGTGTNPDFVYFGADLASVPEPASAAALMCVGWILCRRRRGA